MTQANKLLDLLADDEEEEELENTNEFQALLRSGILAEPSALGSSGEGSRVPGTTIPGLSHQGHATADSQQPFNQRGASAGRSALPVQMLLEWCKRNLLPAEMAQVVSLMKEMKGAGTPKSTYQSIYNVIGEERMKLMRAYIIETKGRGEASKEHNASNERNAVTSRPPSAPQQGAQPSGRSIMQSLVYNAEQARQQPGRPPSGGNAPQPPARAPQTWQQSGGQAQPQYPAQVAQTSSAPGSQHQTPAAGQTGATNQAGQMYLHPAVGQPSSVRPVLVHSAQPVPNKQVADNMTGSQPAVKKPKREKGDVEEENDVLKDSGVNLEEEQSALLGTLDRGGGTSTAPTALPEDSFLNLTPLGHKDGGDLRFCDLVFIRHKLKPLRISTKEKDKWLQVIDIAKRHGLEVVDPQVGQLLSRAMGAHLGPIVERLYAMARQRTDADRNRPGMALTTNLRRRLHEHNMQLKKQQDALDKAEPELPAIGSKRKLVEDDVTKKTDRASKKEAEKQQASAANAAAAAAFGGKAQKWGAWSQDATKKPTAKPAASKGDAARPGPTAPLGQGIGGLTREKKADGKDVVRGNALPPSRVKSEMLSAKLADLVAVLEQDPMYEKSALLFRLYAQLSE